MATFPQQGDTFGAYRITGRLGQGAMGVVFRAVQVGLNRELALKVLSPQHAETAEFRERFAREAALLASLDSPHIIQIFDYGEHDGCLYIATQLVKDGDLGESLKTAGPMPLSEALDVVAQLAGALNDAHAAGVVHRDVKPSNVLVRRASQRTHAYLCDFGIARAGDRGLTEAGAVIGSYGYLAPERLSGAAATPASDIYSLGCLLVTSVTGRLPYSGTDLEVAELHLTSPIPQWEESTPSLAMLNGVLRRAMAKDPEDRYASAQDMRQALLRAAEQVRSEQAPAEVEPTTRRPVPIPSGSAPTPSVPAGEPVTSGTTRKRWWAAGVAAAALVVIVGGVTWAMSSPDDPRGSEGKAGAQAPATDDTPTTPTPMTTAPGLASTCWTGASAGSACPEPTGLKGLEWVFPSLERMGTPPCGRSPLDADEGNKKLEWECGVRVGADGTVTITYSEWDTWQDADFHYRVEEYEQGSVRRRGGVLTYEPLEMPNGNYRSSMMYASPHPFSVTAIGETPAAVTKGLALVDLRPPGAFER